MGDRAPTPGEWFEMVLDFHERFGSTVGDFSNPGFGDNGLRLALIDEERNELCEAVTNADFVGAVDAIGDLIYVLIGTAIAWGVDLYPVMSEIHRSNMTKAGGGSRVDGKILKGRIYKPPNIAGCLNTQRERDRKHE